MLLTSSLEKKKIKRGKKMYAIEGKKILITGGAGFIGSYIADALVQNKAEKVIILDNFVRGREENLEWAKKNGNVQVVHGDIRDAALVNDLVKDCDYVFHEAAIRIIQCMKEPRDAHEVMVDGTYNVFEACVKNNVKKLIFASSASVYGNPEKIPMVEDHPLNNDTLYGAGKIYAEELAKALRKMYGLNYIGLRYFNVYGPRMDVYGVYTEVLIKWLEKIEKGESPILHGDGMQMYDFVYGEDVARANIIALQCDKNEGVYNVGTGVGTPLKEVLVILLKLKESLLQPTYAAPKDALPVTKRVASIEKAQRELGFVAETSIKEGLKRLITWKEKIEERVPR